MKRLGSVAFVLSLVSGWGGCGPTVQEQAELAAQPLEAPPRATFPHVANAMQIHCGTLDCHGQISRDLRLYGLHGLRLDPKDNPLAHVTTRAEYDASYRSIIGLEPEVLSFVVASALRPERLTMVRKARGIEKHKGGQLMLEGDPLDRCLVTWITHGLEDAACGTVLHAERPQLE
jgi:hypothetical protein